MNKKKIRLARKKIDHIDRGIFKLIKKRTGVVKYMLSLKEFKNQIVDRRRINEILKNIKHKSKINNIDPKITTQIWKSIIWSYIEYQKKNIKKK